MHKLCGWVCLLLLAQLPGWAQKTFQGQELQDSSGQNFMEEVPSPHSVPSKPVLPQTPVGSAYQGFRYSGNGNLLPFVPSDTGLAVPSPYAGGGLEIYNEYYVPRWILPGDPNQSMFVPFDPYALPPYPYYYPNRW